MAYYYWSLNWRWHHTTIRVNDSVNTIDLLGLYWLLNGCYRGMLYHYKFVFMFLYRAQLCNHSGHKCDLILKLIYCNLGFNLHSSNSHIKMMCSRQEHDFLWMWDSEGAKSEGPINIHSLPLILYVPNLVWFISAAEFSSFADFLLCSLICRGCTHISTLGGERCYCCPNNAARRQKMSLLSHCWRSWMGAFQPLI